jgi:hypothetical protein
MNLNLPAMQYLPCLAFALFILAPVAALIIKSHQITKRRQEMQAFAENRNLRFSPEIPDELNIFSGYHPFDDGHDRRVDNLITGLHDGVHFRIFDYEYVTGEGKNKTTHHAGVVVGLVPLTFPRMTLRAEGILDRLAAVVGLEDINFESDEFNRRYHITCDNRKRAYELIDPGMIDFLLSIQPRHWQLGPNIVMITRTGRYPTQELPIVMESITGFVKRIPEFVRQDITSPDLGLYQMNIES